MGLQTAALVRGIASVLVGGVATAWVVHAGHSGATAAWGDVGDEPGQSLARPGACPDHRVLDYSTPSCPV
jgi:hypothetical protein